MKIILHSTKLKYCDQENKQDEDEANRSANTIDNKFWQEKREKFTQIKILKGTLMQIWKFPYIFVFI